MFDRTVFQSETRGNPLAQRRPIQVEAVQELPAVPVLPQTLLCLDIIVQKPCVDLRELSELVLSDLGATLQVLRLAGREHAHSEGRFMRMEDCISHLGLDACMEAILEQTAPRDSRRHAIAESWAHARDVAQYAKMMAEEMVYISGEEAYLAGLLHGIGFLPALLGWNGFAVSDAALTGLRLAKRWSLPHCVTEFFGELQMTGYSTRWLGIVRKAHQSANKPTAHCLFEQGVRLQVLRHG